MASPSWPGGTSGMASRRRCRTCDEAAAATPTAAAVISRQLARMAAAFHTGLRRRVRTPAVELESATARWTRFQTTLLSALRLIRPSRARRSSVASLVSSGVTMSYLSVKDGSFPPPW